jgi:hypothetical protein
MRDDLNGQDVTSKERIDLGTGEEPEECDGEDYAL